MNKLDNNTIIGLILIGVIMMWIGFTSTPPAETSAVQKVETSDETTADDINEEEEIPSSIEGIVMADFSNEEFFSIENDLIYLNLSNKGASIRQAIIKNQFNYKKEPLKLVDENLEFKILLGKVLSVPTDRLFFRISDKSESHIRFSAEVEGKPIHITYHLRNGSYRVEITVESPMLQNGGFIDMKLKGFRLEKNRDFESNRTTVYYHLSSGKLKNLSETRSDSERAEQLDWIAFRHQFFSLILNSKNEFPNAEMTVEPLPDENYTKLMTLRAELPSTSSAIDMNLYMGPNKFVILKKYKNDYEKLIPLGWGIFGWINRGVVIPIFNWLESYGLNYGLIILLMAIMIKIVIFPFTYGSYRSMAKMRILKPEMDEINEKYKDEKDQLKKQQALMELYKKSGVNPLGGCIPLLFQLPILFAVFQFFPASFELRGQSFLWAEDLSTYDSVFELPFRIPGYGSHVSLFTLLMTISTIIYTWMNQQLTPQNNQYPQLKYMMYLMPVIFLGVFNNYAAGLTYYYFVSNLITFGQQYAIKSFIDEEKLHAKIKENQAREVKPSKFMQTFEQLAKEQQIKGNRSLRRKKI
ncbi:membrane protein insertase YidC [Schleiferia thermophila]|jgi:YidC/Oxa1 family membrane protein insertase|uniref:membrane protein insertase YidC n=1 Tax=Schleiferia thermophila TaxID=884107 RepID=UPI0004E75D8D|nr:membrane protein insertase YidC [Schleiferia thermophila]KFD40112.1 membrane protein [Schleiferia thermophila str. Yellowstone]